MDMKWICCCGPVAESTGIHTTNSDHLTYIGAENQEHEKWFGFKVVYNGVFKVNVDTFFFLKLNNMASCILLNAP